MADIPPITGPSATPAPPAPLPSDAAAAPSAPLTPEATPLTVAPGQPPASSWKKPCCYGCLVALAVTLLPVIAGGYFLWTLARPVYLFVQDASVALKDGTPEALLTLTTPAFQEETTAEELEATLDQLGGLDGEKVDVADVNFEDGRGVIHLSIGRKDGGMQPFTVWLAEVDGRWRIDGVALREDGGPPKPGVQE